MGIFISPSKTIECVVAALCLGLLMALSSKKLIAVLQQGGYSGRKMLKWLGRRGNLFFTRLSLLALLCLLSSLVAAVCFSFTGRWAAIISLVPFAVFFAVFIAADGRIALKVPAVRTKRYGRLGVVHFLVCAIAAYLALTLLNFAAYCWGNELFDAVKYCILAVLPLLLPALVCLSNCIDKIYEVPRNRSYIKKAKAKLEAGSVTVIGITGSYGKTTVKHILAAMLAKKYRVLATPRSYNTPAGIAMTVNGNDLKDYDVFIAEMGAKNVGDIAQLCSFCRPEYAVISGICPQHLQSFGSEENIVKAKAEILEGAKRAYIAEDCAQLFGGYAVEKAEIAEVKDVTADCGGTRFTLSLGGKDVKMYTKLLGEHSAYNIALAATLAYDMGVSPEDIAEAAAELGYVEHRLQLIRQGEVNIIDDGYNTNVRGAEAALKVLRTFGGRKIAVTPGMVEMGILGPQENRRLGGMLAGLDLVILVGDTLVAPVKEGYSEAGGDSSKLIIKGTLKDAEAALREYVGAGDTVLFLNDLPDIY